MKHTDRAGSAFLQEPLSAERDELIAYLRQIRNYRYAYPLFTFTPDNYVEVYTPSEVSELKYIRFFWHALSCVFMSI